MATTQLADVLAAGQTRFARTMLDQSTKSSAFFNSGAVAPAADLEDFAMGPGSTFERPMLDDIPDTESTQGDDTETALTPEQLTGKGETVRKHNRVKAVKAADLAATLGDTDPMGIIVQRMAPYWGREYDSFCISSIIGVFEDNLANDSGDMIFDAYADIVTPLAANGPSGSNIIEAEGTIGDANLGAITLIVVHSDTYTQMRKDNLIADIPDARGEVLFPFYQNKRVIIDDNMPVIAGTNTPAYTTALVGNGFFGWAPGMPKVPAEIEREALQGSGFGQETLVSRSVFVLHPNGFDSTDPGGLVNGQSPTNTQIEAATYWDRIVNRKNIPIAFLRHNIPA